MNLTAADIAKLAKAELRGDGALPVTGAAPLETAGPGDLAFLADASLAAAAAASKAGCLLARPAEAGLLKDFKGALLVTENPKLAFVLALRLLERERRPLPPPGVHASAVVAASAKLGRDVSVGPCAVVEDGAELADGASVGAQCYVGRGAKIGAGARLYPGVKVMDACEIGAEAILHAGTVIGSDGFGYVSPQGRHEKIPQLGRVVIGDRVEIGANCAVDRAALDATVIGEGTKLDNLVHIAHNVKIGRHCLIMGQVGIAGSTSVGDGVIIAGQAALADHITVGDRTIIMGKSGVTHSLGPNELVFGHYARPRMETMRIEALLGKLPEMNLALRKIKKHLGLNDSAKDDKKSGNA